MPPIRLTLIDETAYVFNADDYMKIRCEHRIVGKLIGCSVKWPRNTNLSGLPAIFSPYQTQLLIDKGIAVLLRRDLDSSPAAQSIQEYDAIREQHSRDFSSNYSEKKIADSRKLMDKILGGKRKKVAKNGGNPDEVTEDTVIEEIKKRCQFDTFDILVQVPTQEPFAVDELDVRSVPALDRLKYRIFCDLWERGKWITSGETFGGDFLIYPGEPLYFHASHIVHVLSTNGSTNVPVNTLVTKGRMSIVVNKFCVLAYESANTREINYQTLQWLGK